MGAHECEKEVMPPRGGRECEGIKGEGECSREFDFRCFFHFRRLAPSVFHVMDLASVRLEMCRLAESLVADLASERLRRRVDLTHVRAQVVGPMEDPVA